MDDHTKASALGFGLVMFTLLAAIVIKHVQSGRSAFSHLEKTVELPVESTQLNLFLAALRDRLTQLGFKAVEKDTFVQGEPDPDELGTTTHAKIKKMLTLRIADGGTGQTTVRVTLRYLDLVVVDSGESAYRDAVLDFVSGKTNAIVMEPNESLLAIHSLLGGAMACLIAGWLIGFDKLNLWWAIPIVAVTSFAVGLLAIFSISQKPREIVGRWKAVAGMILSFVALAASLFFIISRK